MVNQYRAPPGLQEGVSKSVYSDGRVFPLFLGGVLFFVIGEPWLSYDITARHNVAKKNGFIGVHAFTNSL